MLAALGASLHPCADLEKLPWVSQVMRDLGVCQILPVTTPLIVCCFGSIFSTHKEKAKSLFETLFIMECLFNMAKTYLHEVAFAQLAWLLPAATNSAANERCPRFLTRLFALSDIKTFPKRLLSSEGLLALLRRTNSKPLEQRISRVSFTTGMAHHYFSFDSASVVQFITLLYAVHYTKDGQGQVQNTNLLGTRII